MNQRLISDETLQYLLYEKLKRQQYTDCEIDSFIDAALLEPLHTRNDILKQAELMAREVEDTL